MSYVVEWVAACIVPATVVVLLVPGFVLIGVVVIALALAVVVVALTAAIVATPYLLGSFLRRHWRALRADGQRPALPGALHDYAEQTEATTRNTSTGNTRLIARRPR